VNPVDVYQCYGRTYCLHPQDRTVLFTENGSGRNLRNFGNYLLDYTASHPKRVNFNFNILIAYNYLVGCDAV
jgi:hypothetical protein